MTAGPSAHVVALAGLTVIVAARVAAPRATGRAVPSPQSSEPSTPPPAHRWRAAAGLVTLTLSALLVAGPLLAIAAATSVVVAPRVRRIAAGRTTQHARRRAFPDVLDLLIIAIRSGLTPRQAVGVVAGVDGPCQSALAEVVRRVQRGQPFADAMRALDEFLGPWATASVDAIATCDRYGLPLGPMLDELTADARTVRQRVDQAAARRLPVMLSFPLVVCTLPSFVLLAIVPAVVAALSSLRLPAW